MEIPLEQRLAGGRRRGKEGTYFGGTFSLPGPEDPTISLLESDELGLDEALDVGTVGITETIEGAGVLSVTGADVVRILATLFVGTIVAGTDTTTVEPLGISSV